MKQTPQTIKALIIGIIIAGILGSLTVLAIESIGVAGVKIFAICLTLIICGITATVSLVVAEKPEYKTLGNAGLIISVLVFVLTAVVIVAEISDQGFGKFVGSLFLVSIGLAHISLLHHFNLQNKYARYARMTATVSIVLFSVLMITRIFDSFGGYEMFLYSTGTYKITVVVLIFDLAATSLVPLCNRLDVPEKMEINFDTPPAEEQTEKQDPAV